MLLITALSIYNRTDSYVVYLDSYHTCVKLGNLRSVKCDEHHIINKEDENQHIECQKDVDPGSQLRNSWIPYLLAANNKDSDKKKPEIYNKLIDVESDFP